MVSYIFGMLFTILRNVSVIGIAYLKKKCSEGKHYNVALSHATKKLLRTIFAIEKSGQSYISFVSLSL